MKKKLLLMLAFALAMSFQAWADVEINETNFPDGAFRTYVAQFDTDQSGSFSDEELAAVTSIIPTNLGITNLKGIEFFTSVNFLNVNNNNLTDLDVSNLPSLSLLTCSQNQLQSLEFCPELDRLQCDNNQLTELNIPENSQLNEIYVRGNQLTKFILPTMNLDPSQTVFVKVHGNKITEADVRNAKLTELSINDNLITELDLTGQDQLATLNVSTNPIASLNLSDCTNLSWLGLVSTQITQLDLSHNTKLGTLGMSLTPLQELDVSNHTSLELLELRENNNLEKVNVSGCVNLQECFIFDNPNLTELNVSGCNNMHLLDCSHNALSSLDITSSLFMLTLNCSDNKLTELLLPEFGMSPFELACFNNELKDESVDQIVKKFERYFPTGFQTITTFNSNQPIEGNEMNYTLSSGLNQFLSTGHCQLFTYTGTEPVNHVTSWDVLYGNQESYSGGTASLVLDENGYGTFTCVIPFDLDNVYGPRIYKVESAENDKVNLVEASGSVEAGTGIVLAGEPGEEVFIPSAYWDWSLTNSWWMEEWGYWCPGDWACSPLENNLLVGNLTKRTFAAGEAYILKGGKFVLTQGEREELPCHTAYLPADAVINGADVLNLVGDGITGVEDISAPVNDENAPIFDVMGRRVINPQAGGVYIQNGKKFIQQ